jgi:hypothetical protein
MVTNSFGNMGRLSMHSKSLDFGVSPFDLTFLLLSSSEEHYARRYRAGTPPC